MSWTATGTITARNDATGEYLSIEVDASGGGYWRVGSENASRRIAPATWLDEPIGMPSELRGVGVEGALTQAEVLALLES